MRRLCEIGWRFGVVALIAESLLWACEGDGPVWSRRSPEPSYVSPPTRVYDPESRYPPDQIDHELEALSHTLLEMGAWPPVVWQVLDVDLYVRDELGTFRGPDGETWATEGTASATAVQILAGLSDRRLREVLAAEFVDHRVPFVCVGDWNTDHAPWWSGKTAEVYTRSGQTAVGSGGGR